MRKALIIIYSVFSIIAFCALCGVTGYLFLAHYSRNLENFEKRLIYYKNDIRTWYREFQSFDSGLFRTGMENIVKNEEHLFLFTIYSPAKGLIYGIEKRKTGRPSYIKSTVLMDIRKRDPRWAGIPEYRDLPLIRIEFEKKLMDEPMVNIDVMFHPFLKKDIAGIFKWGFLSLILWLVVTILIRLFAVTDPPPAKIINTKQGTPPPGDSDAPGNTKEYVHYSEDTFSLEKKEQAHYQDLQEDGEKGNYQSARREGIQQLFSPQTGLGWKEHLSQRLGFEINRTASFNQDMVLSFISIDKFKELTSSSEIYVHIAKIILSTFPFQDLAFEYGPGTYGIILPDADLNEGIKNLELFQKKITGKVLFNQAVTVSIGLSSRNGRLLSPETIIKEAHGALQKANSGGRSRIIAFKADPEKYRKTLSQKSP